jgi:hypothetical protein
MRPYNVINSPTVEPQVQDARANARAELVASAHFLATRAGEIAALTRNFAGVSRLYCSAVREYARGEVALAWDAVRFEIDAVSFASLMAYGVLRPRMSDVPAPVRDAIAGVLWDVLEQWETTKKGWLS